MVLDYDLSQRAHIYICKSCQHNGSVLSMSLIRPGQCAVEEMIPAEW